MESGNKSDENSTMSPLISEEDMDAMDSGDDSDDEHMCMEMSEYIRDSIKYHLSANGREALYKIHDRIKQSQA